MGTVLQNPAAFKLLLFRCPIGHAEVLWNSRDGAIPYQIQCRFCQCRAESVEHLVRMVKWEPPVGMRIFVTLTHDLAVESMKHFVPQWWNLGPEGFRLKDDFPDMETAIKVMAKDAMAFPSAPHICTVGEDWPVEAAKEADVCPGCQEPMDKIMGTGLVTGYYCVNRMCDHFDKMNAVPKVPRPCPFCAGRRSHVFSHFMLEKGKRIEVQKRQCEACGAEATEAMWNTRLCYPPADNAGPGPIVLAQAVDLLGRVGGFHDLPGEFRLEALKLTAEGRAILGMPPEEGVQL